MQGFIDTILAFAEANAEWAAVIAFALAFAETTLLLSIFVPSTTILFGFGALSASGALHLAPIWIGGALGSALGSSVSYALGRHYGDWALSRWPLSRRPDVTARAKETMRRWGVAALPIAHFLGPLRPVIFALAGLSLMRFPRFLAWDIVGCIAWAYAIPMSGQLGGDAISLLWRLATD
ncbi:DedA family protein [Pseudoroseicyclus tamaricis]|uniref:DedA family protein n=1 Tax=Pseudoroseicyclus tamaricis TaxID=2705421 RepID=A0A6B2JP68_9RHOB|nr:DedA family protein [Pseudoroseicyclus tamaricis]NDU99734.1 DedA family protein [Pseudoroseicyclus tamaricis]